MVALKTIQTKAEAELLTDKLRRKFGKTRLWQFGKRYRINRKILYLMVRFGIKE